MASTTQNFTVNKFDKSVTMTINVKVSKQFIVRKWIALSLIKLAATILGCGIKVED